MHNLIPEVEEARRFRPETAPPGVDVQLEKDVQVPMRDGLDLAANVYRPPEDGSYPVIMAFTIFGKDEQWNAGHPGWGITEEPNTPTVTGTASFEANEPAFWVGNDYALVLVDTRGSGRSPSDADADEWNLFARDYYDAIEWAGNQEWSNGNVGLSGVSYLGFTQWRPAAMNPSHLKAINPWEAFTDFARDTFKPGGIPETGFHDQERSDALHEPAWDAPKHEDPPKPWDREEDDFLSDITVPALICGTWGDQGYHTRGTFRGFRKISSEHKWLYTHGRQKWAEFYSADARMYRKLFFDHFLKGNDDRILDLPPVRMEVRETLDDYTVRFEEDFPIPRTEYNRFALDGESNSLQRNREPPESAVSYDSALGRAVFEYTFDEETEISGYSSLRLWVSPEDADDMDLFVTVRKFDADGNQVYFDDCIAVSRWPVAVGWLRLSLRELDEEKSTPWEPYQRSVVEQGENVEPGEIVPCDIAIPPASTRFFAGETLQLSVSGLYQDGNAPDHDWLEYSDTVNEGRHTIYTGGEYNSSLLLPIVPPK